ncbi:hypothetical protein [Flavobacterium sp. B17]|uniref:hypothetical protein n=1 Tax=Flavobacterium sp. B17 TaxID=95618 RepID=UPI0011D1C1EC|nr:hypothetical protein [Flavobacterium sp. B17]
MALLCFFVVLVSSFFSAQTFLSSDSVVFVSEDSYLYAESPIYISGQTLRKDSFKKWSKTVIKRSSSGISRQKSISSPKDIICYKSSPASRQTFGLLFNSSSIAFIGTSSPVKHQQKIIQTSFILFTSTRRDQENSCHITSYPFQIAHITINHFGRPPPISNTNDTNILSQMTLMDLTQNSTILFAQENPHRLSSRRDLSKEFNTTIVKLVFSH